MGKKNKRNLNAKSDNNGKLIQNISPASKVITKKTNNSIKIKSEVSDKVNSNKFIKNKKKNLNEISSNGITKSENQNQVSATKTEINVKATNGILAKGRGVKKEKNIANEPKKENLDSENFGISSENKIKIESNIEEIKLNKRNKNRLKAEIKKDLIIKGKPKDLLNEKNLKLLEKRLEKLLAKPEPRSKKVERKIILIKSVIERSNSKIKNKKGNKGKILSNENIVNKQIIEISVLKEQMETDASNKEILKKKYYVVFVGNLPTNINKKMLRDYFESIQGIEKIRIPHVKDKKKRHFAYIELQNEEAQQEILKMHGSKLGDKEINIFVSEKRPKGYKIKQNKNIPKTGEALTLTDSQMIEIGKNLKKKNKRRRKKKQQQPKIKIEKD